jgi:hypothetical protein
VPRRKKQFLSNVVQFPSAIPQPESPTRWMDIKEAAAYLRISTWQVRHLLVKGGEVPYVTIGGKGKVILDQRDLDAYMASAKTRAA